MSGVALVVGHGPGSVSNGPLFLRGWCFARTCARSAAQANIIVTNHALLALDAMDDSPVVPDHDVLIIDEGHEFAARATTAATDELSVRSAEAGCPLGPVAPDGGRGRTAGRGGVRAGFPRWPDMRAAAAPYRQAVEPLAVPARLASTPGGEQLVSRRRQRDCGIARGLGAGEIPRYAGG